MASDPTTQVIRHPGTAARMAAVFLLGGAGGAGLLYSIMNHPAPAVIQTPVAPPQQLPPIVVQLVQPPAPVYAPPTAVPPAALPAAPNPVVPTGDGQESTAPDANPAAVQPNGASPPAPNATQSEPHPTSPDRGAGAPKKTVAPPPAAPAVPAPAPTAEPWKPGAAHKLNINTATQAELELLPQVGPAMAKKILEYREKHGRFKTARELDNIKGIGVKTLEKLLPLVTVDSEPKPR